MELFRESKIDFVKMMRGAVVLSLLMIVAGLASLAIKGGPRWSVDFTGGTVLRVAITPIPPIGDVRRVLAGAGYAGAQVQESEYEGAAGRVHEFIISLEKKEAGKDEAEAMQDALAAGLPGATLELRSIDSVGAKVGGELRTAAANSVFASFAVMILYIAVRFVFRYGLAAVVALIHDVTITVGLFSLLDKEISLQIVAALLTLIGYSINDTIVVFDRIRENMRFRRREGYAEVINASINQTLSRTVLTSGFTLITTVCLWLLGGPVIRDFAFCLTFGIVIGTYSSIFIASPILVWWAQRQVVDKRRPQPAM